MTALREAACCSNKFQECHLLARTLRRAPSPRPPQHGHGHRSRRPTADNTGCLLFFFPYLMHFFQMHP